jgi:hypothetical protein
MHPDPTSSPQSEKRMIYQATIMERSKIFPVNLIIHSSVGLENELELKPSIKVGRQVLRMDAIRACPAK